MNDDYEHIDKSVEYILENIPPTERDTSVEFKKLYDAYNSLLQNNCSCANDCSSKLCLHTQNYIKLLNEKILNPTIYERGVIYECTDLCRCDPLICLNRLLQFGPRRNLKIQDFSHIGKNYGLVTLNPIPAGGFICEYAGELLTKSMAAERQNYNEKYKKMNYIICVNEYITTQSDGKDNFKLIQSFIDPSKHGNIGRYINHSCLPNSEILIVRIDNPLPRLGIFAKQQINPNEEICFDYAGMSKNQENIKLPSFNPIILQKCLCGNNEKCRKFLPFQYY